MMQIPQEIEDIQMESIEPLLNYDWDEAIIATEGETSKLLKICKMQCEMFRKSSCKPMTPAVLSWMTLWIRNFNLLQGTISVLESDIGVVNAGQEFVLRMLWRPAFELWITLNYIFSESAQPMQTKEIEKHTLGHRLCAYLAWCLWNDKEVAHKFTQGWRLDTLFNTKKTITAENENKLNQIIETLWGDENTYHPDWNRETKKNVRMNSLNKRNQLRKWLQHEKLCDFEERIRLERPLNYFVLVEPENKSLAGLLRSSWSDAGYPSYQESSALIHGSTFTGHMEFIDGHIFPHIVKSEDDVQLQAAHVRRHCHFNALTMQWIQERMEKEDLA